MSTNNTLDNVLSSMKLIQANFKSAVKTNITGKRREETSKIEAKYDIMKTSLNSEYNKKIDDDENVCIKQCSSLKEQDPLCIQGCQDLGTKYDNLICDK